jgi:hypothetical protein
MSRDDDAAQVGDSDDDDMAITYFPLVMGDAPSL